MKYLTSFGAVWKLSDKAYKKFLTVVATGQEWNLNDYGKCIISDLVGVTDLTPDGAKDDLKRLKYKRSLRDWNGGRV